MPRITADVFTDNSVDSFDGPDLDTADRLRSKAMRDALHEARDSESDARVTPRQTIADYEYRAPTNLDAPPPRPGYVQRWVRYDTKAEADLRNWQSKLREGWRPRDPKTVPESEYWYGLDSKRGNDLIAVGGLVLMEAPEHVVIAKRKAIAEAARRMERSVSTETDKVSREGVAQGHAPIVREEVTHVSTGRRPNTLAD